MRRILPVLLIVLSACTTVPDGAYYPGASRLDTSAVAHALHRAARGGGDDAARYSFALVATPTVTAWAAEDATFYVAEGLVRQPRPVMEALVAQQVAHEVLNHAGQRRALSLSLMGSFTALGLVLPGAGLLDYVVSPIVVQAFSREQTLAADRKAVEILRAMGYDAPARTLVHALRAAAAVNGPPTGGLLAREPSLDDRLANLEPLEPVAGVARR
jgi:predicted Zn-dependent protease